MIFFPPRRYFVISRTLLQFSSQLLILLFHFFALEEEEGVESSFRSSLGAVYFCCCSFGWIACSIGGYLATTRILFPSLYGNVRRKYPPRFDPPFLILSRQATKKWDINLKGKNAPTITYPKLKSFSHPYGFNDKTNSSVRSVEEKIGRWN